jgi:small subunit ribosomal protein S7
MSRRISTKKRFPEKDFKYDNLLVSLLVNRILKNGKKRLARRIVYKAFELIEFRTNQNPILILEKAIRNISPRVQLKAKRVGGATYQVPTLLNKYRATNIAVRWVIEYSRRRSGKGMSLNLANELLEAAKGSGNSIKKKEETHKMAEANKAFAQFR